MSCLVIHVAVMQELQAVKGKVEELTCERDKACSESVIVRQQRDCHADHAQLLVKENKRLLGQLQALKVQQAQMSVAAAQQEAKLSASSSAKSSVVANVSKQEQQAQSVGKEKSIRRIEPDFTGEDVQNVLHDKPFDLSLKVLPKQRTDAQAVLQQAQQIRAAKRRS